MIRRAGITALALLLALPGVAAAQPDVDPDAVELELLRRKVADQLQLKLYDLLDELVYQWTQDPPFDVPTPVFLASLTVPVGTGTGLLSMLENHLAEVILANPNTGVKLSHCPACTAVITHSGPKGTVVSRGMDNPEALAQLTALGGRHGLYVDIAAEGAWLVLRARITELTPDLPIVWSRTISSAVGSGPLLRSKSDLKSAEDARAEYLDSLHQRGPWEIPVRFSLRVWDRGGGGNAAPVPLIWLQTGIELGMSQARAWTAEVTIGGAWLPEAYAGVMAQSRIYRLLTGTARSLTRPNVYLFIGGAIQYIEGTAITTFTSSGGTSPDVTWGSWQLGFDARLGNRIGLTFFLENSPVFNSSNRFGDFGPGLIPFQSLGTEITVRF